MKKFVFAFAYLLAANLQAGLLVLGASLFSRFLDEKYAMGFSWRVALVPVSIIMALYFYYQVIRAIIRLDKNKKGQV